MLPRNRKAKGRAAPRKQRAGTRAWLGPEIELMMRERERLLHAAGAAAALISSVDVRKVGADVREPLYRLGATLASLTDETLSDAMEALLGARVAGRSRAH